MSRVAWHFSSIRRRSLYLLVMLEGVSHYYVSTLQKRSSLANPPHILVTFLSELLSAAVILGHCNNFFGRETTCADRSWSINRRTVNGSVVSHHRLPLIPTHSRPLFLALRSPPSSPSTVFSPTLHGWK